MTPPTTTDEFLYLLEHSLLLRSDQFASFLPLIPPDLPPKEGISRRLVREGLLTSFQSQQLLRGRYKGFFLTDKYKVLDVIGEGGMGRVLLCEHLMLQRLVAVKILNFRGQPPPPGTTERFLREARAAAALDHVNITRVFDADYSFSGPFIVMEYVDGTNLHKIVADHGPLSSVRAANYTYQASLALGQADKMGLTHRDIKPGNLLLDRSGLVKLLDLGLARFNDDGKNDSLTMRFDARNVLGTADFISPEQTENSSQVDIRADIYSLGCTLYYLLTRRLPFEGGSTTQKLLWHRSVDIPAIKESGVEIPDELNQVLLKMTRKKPDQRYQTPAELSEALKPWNDFTECPPSVEMPRVQPKHYRLGLSPAMVSGANAEGHPSSSESFQPNSARTAPVNPSHETQGLDQTLPDTTTEFPQMNVVEPPNWENDSIEATCLNRPIEGGLTREDGFNSGEFQTPLENYSRSARVAPIPVEIVTPPASRSKVSRHILLLTVSILAVFCLGLSTGAFLIWIAGQNQLPFFTPSPTGSEPGDD